MKYLAVACLVACSKPAPPAAPPFVVTGAVTSLTGAPVGCATPLQIKLYDVTALLLEADAAPALATCTADATGSFTCSSTSLGGVGTALIGIIDDADNSKGDCISTTVSVVAACSPTCATSAAGKDGSLSGSDVLPVIVPPAHFLQSLEATIAEPSLGSLVDSGAVLNLVVGNDQAPQANALPWLPLACQSTLSCRAVPIDNSGQPSDVTVTGSSGLWLAQVVDQSSGTAKPISLNLSQAGDPGAGYGAVDCSSSGICYQPLPAKPFRSAELGAGIDGVVTMNFVAPTAAVNGACPISTAAAAAGKADLVSCP